MPKFQFSLSKLQKYQKQKQKMAEFEIARCKAERDLSVRKLKDLFFRLDQANIACREEIVGKAHLILAHKDWIENLNREIELVRQKLEEYETALMDSIAAATTEKQQTELYDALCKSEEAIHNAEVEKSEQNEIADFLLRKLPVSEGDSNDV